MKNTLAFQVIVLYREFLSYTTDKLKTLGLNFGQMPLILYVGKHEGCTQADLTRALKLDWGYSQRSIVKLAGAGFMTKKHMEKENCNCLRLTENGKRAFDVCHQVFDEWDDLKMKDLSREDRDAAITLMKGLSGIK